MDLRLRIDSSIPMFNQVFKDGVLLGMFVDIGFEHPVASLTLVGKGMQCSSHLTGGIVDVIGPKKVASKSLLNCTSITSLHVWLQISPTHMVMSPNCKFFKDLAVVDLKCRIHNS